MYKIRFLFSFFFFKFNNLYTLIREDDQQCYNNKYLTKKIH